MRAKRRILARQEFSSHADCGGIWIWGDERRKDSWEIRGCDIEQREPRGKPVVKMMKESGLGRTGRD